MSAGKWVRSLIIVLAIVIVSAAGYYIISTTFHTSATNVSVNDRDDSVYQCEMKVHFIDVGKADSTLIQCGDNDILIDGGDVSSKNVVSSYLSRQGVDDVELVIATHPDRDHIGQLESVVSDYPVERFMMPEVPEDKVPTNSTYKNLMNAIDAKGIKTETPVAGQALQFGDIRLDILAPVQMAKTTNGNSIVSRATYKNRSFLFMGDADKKEENDILKQDYSLKSDVLKVGHHGSKTSSGLSFLNQVNPMYAVISVAPDRSSLPKQETIDSLNSVGANILRTDINGTVIIGTDGGDDLMIKTEK